MIDNITSYCCRECSTTWGNEEGAAQCCDPVKRYICPKCDVEHETIKIARACCDLPISSKKAKKRATRHQCPDCSTLHQDKCSAAECCEVEVEHICPKCSKPANCYSSASICCFAGIVERCPTCARDFAHNQRDYHMIQLLGACGTCRLAIPTEVAHKIDDTLKNLVLL